ncbi:MAG TPA: phosphoribosyltransferase family protein [Thermoanaerobaculia bacterium]|nr:phosphoribosyltransferase family protein [Thermoanaerobaculia bacterium]
MNLTPITSSLRLLGRETARIVLAASCIVCQENLSWTSRRGSCCERCWLELPAITGTKCRRCSTPFQFTGERELATCIPCSASSHACAWIDAWGEYRGSLERVLHAFKFDRHDFLSTPLSTLLVERLRARGDAFDVVVPVPMHGKKRRKRGYNQAELLAKGVVRLTGLEYDAKLLVKREERRTQSTLPREERKANVRDLFTASERAAGKSVLLVDDISTTGETLEACAIALVKGGAARVCAVVVAKA